MSHAPPVSFDDTAGIGALDAEDRFVLRGHLPVRATFITCPEPCPGFFAVERLQDAADCILQEIGGKSYGGAFPPMTVRLHCNQTRAPRSTKNWNARSFFSTNGQGCRAGPGWRVARIFGSFSVLS